MKFEIHAWLLASFFEAFLYCMRSFLESLPLDFSGYPSSLSPEPLFGCCGQIGRKWVQWLSRLGEMGSIHTSVILRLADMLLALYYAGLGRV